MNPKLFQRRTYFWIFWVLANSIGFAIGWSAGEVVGQFVGKNVNWPLGELLAWGMFQVSVWIMRTSILHQVREFSKWRTLDSMIWVGAETLGWLIAISFADLIDQNWTTVGAVWGSIFGASLWIIIWLIIRGRVLTEIQQTMGRVYYEFLRQLVGSVPLFLGSMLLTMLFLIVSLEYGNKVGEMTHPAIGWATSGLILGSLIGGVTGTGFIRILKWPVIGRRTGSHTKVEKLRNKPY